MNEKHLQHYENFPVASWLCPPRLRQPIIAIYRFARAADDIADEGDVSTRDRLDGLAAFRANLELASVPSSAQSPQDPIFGPLAAAIQQFQLPVGLLMDLLDAFGQDVLRTRDRSTYRSDGDLLAYCSKSANPVGRLLLHLHGLSSPIQLAQSDQICSALQLINFWQDLSVDLPRNRHYLTDEVCARFGVTRAELAQGHDTRSTRAMVRHCVGQARALMQRGAPLAKAVPGRAGWELRLVVQGGLRILEKIERLGYGTVSVRPKLTAADLPVLLWRAVWM